MRLLQRYRSHENWCMKFLNSRIAGSSKFNIYKGKPGKDSIHPQLSAGERRHANQMRFFFENPTGESREFMNSLSTAFVSTAALPRKHSQYTLDFWKRHCKVWAFFGFPVLYNGRRWETLRSEKEGLYINSSGVHDGRIHSSYCITIE